MRYGDLEGPGARGEENQLELSLGEWGERAPNDDHEHAVMHGTDADDAQPGGDSVADNAGNPTRRCSCGGEAQRRVVGDYGWFSELTHQLEKVLAETTDRTKVHPKVKEVRVRVDDCVTAAGFDLSKEAEPGSGEVPGLDRRTRSSSGGAPRQENLFGWLYSVGREYRQRGLETQGGPGYWQATSATRRRSHCSRRSRPLIQPTSTRNPNSAARGHSACWGSTSGPQARLPRPCTAASRYRWVPLLGGSSC